MSWLGPDNGRQNSNRGQTKKTTKRASTALFCTHDDSALSDDVQTRAAVEGEKPEPQDEAPQRGQDHVVGGDPHYLDLARLRVGEEASLAGAQDPRSRERCGTADAVDGPTSCKVQDLASQETVRAPDPVADDGVHEARQKDGVNHVGLKLAALGDGPRNNRRCGPRKDILEEPANIVFGAIEEEIVSSSSDERVAASPVRKSITAAA